MDSKLKMTEEQKSILLNDLSGRLPYGVKVGIPSLSDKVYTLKGIRIENNMASCELECKGILFMPIELVRPYLFPLSSMNEEQDEEYGMAYEEDHKQSMDNLKKRLDGIVTINGFPLYNHVDCLNKIHFDYRGLIEQGLANDATNLNIY